MDRHEDVEDAEARLVEEEQYKRMSESERNGGICRPLVQTKKIQAQMRPMPHRTVAQRNEQADQEIESGRACCPQSEICAKIQQGHVLKLAVEEYGTI